MIRHSIPSDTPRRMAGTRGLAGPGIGGLGRLRNRCVADLSKPVNTPDAEIPRLPWQTCREIADELMTSCQRADDVMPESLWLQRMSVVTVCAGKALGGEEKEGSPCLPPAWETWQHHIQCPPPCDSGWEDPVGAGEPLLLPPPICPGPPVHRACRPWCLGLVPSHSGRVF